MPNSYLRPGRMALGSLAVALFFPLSVLALPTPSVDDVTVVEGNTGTVSADFTVSLSEPSTLTAQVSWSVGAGTASANDYEQRSGTAIFSPGETAKIVSILVKGDLTDEPDETFQFHLDRFTLGQQAQSMNDTGVGTILDDDTPPAISVGNALVAEGSEGEAVAVFTVSLSAPSGWAVTADFATADGTALAGGDYDATVGTLTFAPGLTSQEVTVRVNRDTEAEPAETFFFDLSNPAHVTIADGQGLGTITDDPVPSISAVDMTVSEVGPLVFTLTLSGASTKTVKVNFSMANGTASATDYSAQSGTLSFNPGQTSKTISVSLYQDDMDEEDETFHLNLANPINATLLNPQGLGTIRDDDDPPTFTFSNVAVTEGSNGTLNLSLSVFLSKSIGRSLSVDYTTADGTALAPEDYLAASGTLVVPSGATSRQSITVVVNGDLTHEPDETFTVTLSNPINVVPLATTSIVTIKNDDPMPGIAVNNVAVTEGNAGATEVIFAVTLSRPSYQAITVDYATADGTAQVPADYAPVSGTLSLAPGETAKTFSVPVNGDLLDEVNETFSVNLSAPTNATLADAQGIGTITDDDLPPSLSIGDAAVSEGIAGPTNAAFTVSLSAPSGQTVKVNYATANGTAQAPGDYAPVSGGGILTFPPGTTSQPLVVAVNGDLLDEPDETFFVNLTSPTDATIADAQGAGTIIDDDNPPALSIDDVSVIEGSSITNALFTVRLAAASNQTVTVNYATADGTALAGTDYVATSGTLTFAPGTANQTILVALQGDLLDEPNKTFFLNLSNSTNAILAKSQGVGTIQDDDPIPALRIDDLALNEGNAGTTAATFTLTLSNPSGQPLGVDFATVDGTATAGTDYAATSGTLTFDPGETSKALSVQVNGDLLDEPDETFLLNLALSSGNAAIADAQGLGAISDDDDAPAIRIDDVALAETDAGTTTALFTATLSAPSGQTLRVDFATADGTALAGSDYTPLAGTLSFSPGTITQTLAVAVNGDLTFEADETFAIHLANPTNATLADAQGQGLIQNDDDEPIAIAPITGTWDVTFGKSNQVHSAVFSGGDIRLNEGSKSQPGLLDGAIEAVGDVRIEAYNHLTGDLTAGGQVKLPAKKQAGTVQVDGVISEYATVTPVTLPPLSFAVNSSNAPKVNIKKREAWDLAPYEQTGHPYGELITEQSATLTLHSGTYYFQRFTLRHDCELILDLQGGPVTINITEGMHLGHHVKVTLRGGDAGQVLFNVAGPGLSQEEGEEDEDRDEWVPQDRQGRRDFTPRLAVRILQHTQFAGTLYAPQGKIRVGHHSQVTGALLARQVRLHQHVAFTGQVARHLELSGPMAKPVALAGLPRGFALDPNYPNPFNPSTTLRYTLSDLSQVRLAIYNGLGQQLRVLVAAVQEAGSYVVAWDGLDERGQQAGAGVYFYRLEIGAEVMTRKMALVR